MPRAFLIKKKQHARMCGSPGSPRRSWSQELENEVMESAEQKDNSTSDAGQPPVVASGVAYLSVVTAGPYDLSMKRKDSEKLFASELANKETPAWLHLLVDDNNKQKVHNQVPTYSPGSTPLIAPKPIKPTAKSSDELAVSRPSWQRQSVSPYLPFNYPIYPYPTKPECHYPYNSMNYLPNQASLPPPPLVPFSPPTVTSVAKEASYPYRERYWSHEIQSRDRASPAVGTSPSPPANYSGWTSDGQDSGLATSPSPSSEDGECGPNPKQPPQTRYQCPHCNKSYSTYSGLAKHRLMHCSNQVKKSFSCKNCEKVYVSLGALKMHIRTHTLPCKCKLCGKAFSRPWLLQGHIRTHTGEKPFACPHCSRAFADRSNLRAHLQTHSEVKKYRCKTCSKTFSRMSLLLKHEDGGCSGVPQQQQQPPVVQLAL